MLEIVVRIPQEIKDWLLAKVRGRPEWVTESFVPVLEKTGAKLHTELCQANRSGDAMKIAYAQGKFDGAQSMIALLGGLKMSEVKKPVEAGLMPRILNFGR